MNLPAEATCNYDWDILLYVPRFSTAKPTRIVNRNTRLTEKQSGDPKSPASPIRTPPSNQGRGTPKWNGMVKPIVRALPACVSVPLTNAV